MKLNDGMFEDYAKLAGDVAFFQAKWGIPLELKTGKTLYVKPQRKYGKGLIKLFSEKPFQNVVNKIKTPTTTK